jgi:hypothetical protein
MQSIDRKKGNEKSVLEEINDVTMFNRKYQPGIKSTAILKD